MKYAIIGCGTGGPAAALFLHRQGHEVVIFERVAHPKPVGAGILLQPTGLDVLRRLGLLQRVLGAGSRVDSLYGETSYGRLILDLAYQDLRPGLFGLGIQRGALFSALWDAVHADGIAVQVGEDIHDVIEDEQGVIVAGTRFDRAVIAAGARSGSRPPKAKVRPYPWGALWAVVPSEISPHCLTQRYRDTRQMVGLLPSGDGHVSVFWSLRVDQLQTCLDAGVEAWKAQVHALLPEAPLESIHHMDQLLFAPYFDVVAPRWNTARRVWIGDAAHAMSPQLGQGANLALLDAAALADAPDFDSYSRSRRHHLHFYSWASRWLTPFFQSSYPLLAPLRDLVGSPLHRWGWYQRQMLQSLAGVKTGVFSTIPLP